MDSKNKAFEFPDTDLELAKLVAEIAWELNPSVFRLEMPKISFDSVVDSLIEQELANEDEEVQVEIKEYLLEKRRQEKENEELEKTGVIKNQE